MLFLFLCCFVVGRRAFDSMPQASQVAMRKMILYEHGMQADSSFSLLRRFEVADSAVERPTERGRED